MSEAIHSDYDLHRDSQRVTEAVRRGAQEAIRRHKQAGLPMAVWRDGQVVWVPAEELEHLDRPPTDRDRPAEGD